MFPETKKCDFILSDFRAICLNMIHLDISFYILKTFPP